MLVGSLNHIGHIQQDVRIRQCRSRKIQHGLLQLVVWFQHARSIREYNLHIVRIIDSHNPMACSLSLEGSNGNTLAYQGIHQCGLAYIGIPYNIYKTCFVHNFTYLD